MIKLLKSIPGVIIVIFGFYILLEGKIPNRGGQYVELPLLWQSLLLGTFFVVFGILVIWSVWRNRVTN